MPDIRARRKKRVERPEDIPEFRSDTEEERFWDEHELGEGMLERMEPLGEDILPPARTHARPVSVRFEADMLTRLRDLAARRGTRYQTLLKQFVAERLYEEERRESGGLQQRSSKTGVRTQNRRIVSPSARGGWSVSRPSSARASSLHDTRADAQRAARRYLRNQGGGEVIVTDRDGRVRDTDSVPPAGRSPGKR